MDPPEARDPATSTDPADAGPAPTMPDVGLDPTMPDLEGRRQAWAARKVSRSWRRRRHTVPAGLVGGAAVGAGIWMVIAPPPPGLTPYQDGAERAPTRAAAVHADEAPKLDPPPTRLAPAAASPASTPLRDCPHLGNAILSADVNEDGCSESVRFSAGTVEAGDRKWAVGASGDQVAVGDWWCNGLRTLALLHPPSGNVFVFPHWPKAGDSFTATALATVADGRTLRTADVDRDGCHELAVDRQNGSTAVLVASEMSPSDRDSQP